MLAVLPLVAAAAASGGELLGPATPVGQTLAGAAAAGTAPGATDPLELAEPSTLWLAGRVLLAAALVGALIVLLMVALRRYGFGTRASGRGAPRLELLASLGLAPRRTVYLLRVDGIELLVGTAGDGLRLLSELPGPRLAAAAAGPTVPGRSAGAAAPGLPGSPSGLPAAAAATRSTASASGAPASPFHTTFQALLEAPE